MQKSPGSAHSDSAHGTSVVDGADAATPRKAYKAPLLTTYGSVTLLTQSGVSVTTEPGGTRTSRSLRKPSDLRLKHNINCIGRHPLGFGLYLFDYKPAWQSAHGQRRQFGVIAQEVEQIVPAAVSLNSAGFKEVDYALLGMQPTLH